MWLLFWSWWVSANPEITTFIYIGNWYLSPTLSDGLLRGRHECFGDSKVQQKEYAWRIKKAGERRCYCHVTRWWLQSGRTKKPVTFQRTVHDNNTLVDIGKQGNQSRNQCLSLTMTKVWWGLIEWNSGLHHTLSYAAIGRCVRSSPLFLKWRSMHMSCTRIWLRRNWIITIYD